MENGQVHLRNSAGKGLKSTVIYLCLFESDPGVRAKKV